MPTTLRLSLISNIMSIILFLEFNLYQTMHHTCPICPLTEHFSSNKSFNKSQLSCFLSKYNFFFIYKSKINMMATEPLIYVATII